MLRVALLLLCSCSDIKEIGGGAGLDLSWIPGVGQVFTCSVGDGEIELCYDGEADELLSSLQSHSVDATECGSTQRHLGPCYFHCDGGRGCNAFAGCWCE